MRQNTTLLRAVSSWFYALDFHDFRCPKSCARDCVKEKYTDEQRLFTRRIYQLRPQRYAARTMARPSELWAGKMLQNKKAAPISGGFKSFVSVRRCGEKVTE
jgi:hypothetical protein